MCTKDYKSVTCPCCHQPLLRNHVERKCKKALYIGVSAPGECGLEWQETTSAPVVLDVPCFVCYQKKQFGLHEAEKEFRRKKARAARSRRWMFPSSGPSVRGDGEKGQVQERSEKEESETSASPASASSISTRKRSRSRSRSAKVQSRRARRDAVAIARRRRHDGSSSSRHRRPTMLDDMRRVGDFAVVQSGSDADCSDSDY